MSDASILIVEDETIVAEDLAKKLRRLGYTVAGMTELGEEALTLARDLKPSLVLMDIRLAGEMDGVAAADRIRCESDVPVIYLTASSDRATIDKAKVTEPFGFILKPFEDRELASHIEMALYKHQAERKMREMMKELKKANAELSHFNGLMVGREIRMIELKKEVDQLCRETCRPTRYGYETPPQKVPEPPPGIP
jgi:two-component system, response regulator PdtaR